MNYNRALPDITYGPEVRQIFKIRIVWKADVFLPGRRTFNTFKNRKKIVYLLGLGTFDTKLGELTTCTW